MDQPLRIEGDRVLGEIALAIPPGTIAAARDRLLDTAIGAALTAITEELQVTPAASPSAFARPLPGKDDAGHTRFEIEGRIEGDRLVPVRKRGA
jgi:hypothetical protein